ncbi:helix-turn-helix domain-containing protein [Psychromonas sp. KJ10-10]|uniref:helix-turn-helix domain-containing protein n=1 Tax=Psychromonas sp. KJ10-10 TaxID=3391823 RepID=UPI0039B45020
MSDYLGSPHAIVAELGERIRTARLNADLTQEELAKKAGISLKAVTNSEKGKSTLLSIVSILVALDMTDQLNSFIPRQVLSPIQLAKLQGKERQRATGNHSKDNSNKISEKRTPSW